MKRLVICGLLIAVVAFVSLYARYSVLDRSESLCDMTDAVLAAYRGHDNSLERLEALERRWGEVRRQLGFFVRTDRLEEISCRVARLKAMYTDGSDDFAAECLELEERLRLLIV